MNLSEEENEYGDSKATERIEEEHKKTNDKFSDFITDEDEYLAEEDEIHYPDHEEIYESSSRVSSSNSRSFQEFAKKNSSRGKSPSGFRIPRSKKPINDYQEEQKSNRKKLRNKNIFKDPDQDSDNELRSVANVSDHLVRPSEDQSSGIDVESDTNGGRRRTDQRVLTGALPEVSISTLGKDLRQSTNVAASSEGNDEDSSEKFLI